MTCLHTRIVAWLPLLCCSLAFGQSGALRITDPVAKKGHTVATSEPAIALRGTLAFAGGDTRVLWTTDRGFSDLATVTASEDPHRVRWNTATPVPLRPGVNLVRIQALGQPDAADFINIYYTPGQTPPPPMGATMLHGQQITYELIDGRAVYQNDMILGTTSDVASGRLAGRFAHAGPHPQSDTIAPNLTYTSGLWPVVNGVVRVPYTTTIDSNTDTVLNQANITAAIAESNTQLAGIVQWVPATTNDVNLVNFMFTYQDDSGTCEAIVGMQGGSQPIGGAENCTVGVIMHEMGHALGLYHEQSRSDRNSYINYQEANVDKPQHGNFDIFASEAVSGLYNYASIMEYGAFSFSRYGVAPVIETIPAGMVLGTNLPQYTTGDLDGIMRLYGFTPSAVTVDTNPTGLQVIVDGTACTAPCVFSNWTINSTHTLNVPLDSHNQTLQTLNQQHYIFGRWNTSAETQSITVTNSAGNGTLLSPKTSPAITNYLASFIPVHPYNPQIESNNVAQPSSVGTVSVSPTPGTLIINNVSTGYFEDRQYISLTVTPKNGYTFFEWADVPLDIYYQANYSFYITSNFDQVVGESQPVTAFFVNDAVTTITAESPDIGTGIYPGFLIGVVETSHGNATTYGYTPVNFDASQDGAGFAAGQTLQLCASGWTGVSCPVNAVTQMPVTTNITYLFYGWNGSVGSNANAVNVTIPANGGQYGANYTDSFRVIILPAQYCTGISVTSSPTGTNSMDTNGNLDAFYSAGTTTFTANTGSSGLNFVEWTQDLFPASTSSYAYSLQGETIATANYNVPGTTIGFPLAVTSISPATPTASNAAVDLVVTGSGFTTNSGVTYAYFGTGGGNFAYRSTTLTSATQLTIHLQAGDIPAVGYYQFLIVNVAPSGCNPQAVFTFPVANSAGAPAFTIAKSHTGNFAPGQQNATYTILVTNSGTASIGAPVTVTEAVPAGETLVQMSGSGWNCSTLPTCTISSSLGAGLSYGAITVTVNVAGNATSPQVNSATVSGGGAEPATATDSTVISSQISVPNVVGLTQTAAQTAITNAGLAVGSVMMQSSNAVASNDVISESPVAGTSVSFGSAVNLVVSSGPTLVSIAVTPMNPSIAKGLTQQFAATGTYTDNSTANLTGSVMWSSGTPGTATITAGGLATVVAANGTSSISATLGAVVGATTLTATTPTLVSIAVTPTNPSIAKGLTQQFTATGTYTDNSTANLTGSVTWSSGTPGTATITTGGLATVVAANGTSSISATLGAVVGATTLTATTPALVSIAVTPMNPSIAKGLTQQFTATGTYTDNSTQNLTNSVTWASGTPGTATITTGGLATVVAANGTSSISATLGAVVGATTLTATMPTLVSIAVTPTNPSIAKGLTQQFTATGTYTDNSTANLTGSVTWASGTPGTATITAGGLATVVAANGTSSISATLGAVVGATTLTATTPALVSIAVTPTNPSIAKGLTQQFTATGTYTDNSTANLTGSVMWSSGTPGTATISTGGLATVVAANGTSSISATLGAVVGATTLTATAPALVSIAVTPTNPSIAKGLTQQFTATGTYTDNSTANLTGSVTWSSGTPGTATITTGGLATVVAANGTSSISATLGAVVGATTLTATTPALVSIAVTPTSPSLSKGLTQQFAATGTYTDNSTANLTGSVMWSSGTPGTATISTGGLATAVGTGTTMIGAKLNSVTGSTTLTVTGLGACDINQDGLYDLPDAQLMINQALGALLAANDLNGDHVVNALDIEIVMNAVLNRGCTL